VEKDAILQKISDQLDMLVSLSKLAYSDKIDKAKQEIVKDEIMAKILELVSEDLTAGDLVSAVCAQVEQKERTIRSRLSELVSKGVLKIEKEGTKSFYRSTGLI
jgi:DNA-binding transcriptional ArsR family regulator